MGILERPYYYFIAIALLFLVLGLAVFSMLSNSDTASRIFSIIAGSFKLG